MNYLKGQGPGMLLFRFERPCHNLWRIVHAKYCINQNTKTTLARLKLSNFTFIPSQSEDQGHDMVLTGRIYQKIAHDKYKFCNVANL